MKIGILTISKSWASYGANLQCYALWKYIDSLGKYDCEVIDLKRPCQAEYKNPHHTFITEKRKDRVISKISLIAKLVRLRRKIPFFIQKRKNYNKFVDFWKMARYSVPCYIDNLYKNEPQYDVIISGSDQIWNFRMPFYTEVFFQSFNFSGKRISYASSMGGVFLQKRYENQIKNWLEKYLFISVREKETADWLKEITGRNVEWCVDPVFLLPKNEWEKLSEGKRLVNGKYIFVFLFDYGYLGELSDTLEKIKTKTGSAEIITMLCRIKNSPYPDINETGSIIGPEEFLNLIKNAEYIITDSFHCLAFSCIFEKNFIVIKDKANKKTMSRIKSLVDLTGTESQLIAKEVLDSFEYREVGYSNCNKLREKINFSKKFLVEALNA